MQKKRPSNLTAEVESWTSNSGHEEPSEDNANASGRVRSLSQKKEKKGNKNHSHFFTHRSP